jgi:hypothetical protein
MREWPDHSRPGAASAEGSVQTAQICQLSGLMRNDDGKFPVSLI